VLVVRPDGSLFQVAEVGDDPRALGDLEHQSIAEILRGDAYLASLDRSEAVTRQRCTGCRYRGACDSWPAHTAAVDHPADARCHVTYRVHEHIERYLRRTGLDESLLRGVAAEVGAPAGG
jgi:radical SAM protein with 4Fe4S-binding SPASM domain